MPRATHSPATRARHKKWLKRAKGYRGRRRTVFKLAKEAVLKAGKYAYRDRRKKKTVQRQLWQIRLNAAVRPHGLSYSKFIQGLRALKVGLDRKVLAELATTEPEIFTQIVAKAKAKVTTQQ